MGWVAASSFALTIQAGALFGLRKVNDAKIEAAYKDGEVYCPYLEIGPWKNLTFSLGYEGGYRETALLGLFQSRAVLSVTGIEFLVGYEHKIASVALYAKTGYALYFYKQIVQDESVTDYVVHSSRSTFVLKGGIKIYPWKFLFAALEIKYVPLTVKPYDYEVDLGGMRYLVGLGVSFDYKKRR